MRNIIYKDMGLVLNKDMKYGILYLDGKETDLIDALESLINVSRETKSEVFTSYSGLKYQKMTVLNYLHMLGFTYINDITKNQMRVGTMRGRFTDGNCFYLQVKTGYKSYVTLQGVESVVGAKSPCESIEDLRKRLELYHYTRDKFLEGIQKSETRVLYSSASISRTSFNRQSRIYSRSGLLHYGHNVELEEWARPGVHGGFNYIDPRAYHYEGEGIVLDVNSLYDYVASASVLPLPTIVSHGKGEPDEKYIRHKMTYYTIMKVQVSATLKGDGIPCIMPDGTMSDITHNYLRNMTKRELTLTESDRRLLYDNYNITYFRIMSYIVFKASRNQFKGYIRPLYEKKRTLKKGDPERDYVKSLLVGFIGTFAKIPYKREYTVVESDKGTYSVDHKCPSDEEYEKNLKKTQGLCYLNSAIVSESRRYIIRFIKKHRDRFLYTDTDSLHLMGADVPDDIPVSDKMGDFKIEHTFTKCCYKGLKNYMFVENGKIVPTVAGFPKDTFEHLPTVKDTDTAYILKALIKKDLTKLYEKPIGRWVLVEDIKSGTISYESSKTYLKKPELPSKAEERNRKREERERRSLECWRDRNIKDGLRGNIQACIREFNGLYKKSGIGFDQACSVLSSMLQTGTVKIIHVKRENDSLDDAMQG